jgi:hypothetical protein
VSPAQVPTLDELTAHPERVKGLPMTVLAGLQLQVSAMQAVIAAEVLTAGGARSQPTRVELESDRTRAPEGAEAEEWIKRKAATARFALPRAWLQRHGVELQRVGIARRLGHRTLVYDARRLDRFLGRTAR